MNTHQHVRTHTQTYAHTHTHAPSPEGHAYVHELGVATQNVPRSVELQEDHVAIGNRGLSHRHTHTHTHTQGK